MIEVVAGALIASIYNINKSIKLDEEAVRKNSKAFTRIADAQRSVEIHQDELFRKMKINATRKGAILKCHLRKFQDIYKTINQINFKEGKGIQEIYCINDIQTQLTRYVVEPKVASGLYMTDSQAVISVALHGITGYMVKDSQANLELASQNRSKANAVGAQAESICIALDGIAERVVMCTELLQKLAAVYMKGINHLQELLDGNGIDESKYTDNDVAAINTCLMQTKLIYRIINTPLIDNEGKLTTESMKIIQEGQRYLAQIL